jgi:hypothetical protein
MRDVGRVLAVWVRPWRGSRTTPASGVGPSAIPSRRSEKERSKRGARGGSEEDLGGLSRAVRFRSPKGQVEGAKRYVPG